MTYFLRKREIQNQNMYFVQRIVIQYGIVGKIQHNGIVEKKCANNAEKNIIQTEQLMVEESMEGVGICFAHVFVDKNIFGKITCGLQKKEKGFYKNNLVNVKDI